MPRGLRASCRTPNGSATRGQPKARPDRPNRYSMALPQLIEIHPIERPIQATVTVPGSKSITNRALVLAVLANGATELRHALWSEDTQVMVDCLRKLGFSVEVAPDLSESGN